MTARQVSRQSHTGIFLEITFWEKCLTAPRLYSHSRGAAIEDTRFEYKRAMLHAYAEDMVAMAMEKGISLSLEEASRRIPQRLTKMRGHSFYRYFHNLKMLG